MNSKDLCRRAARSRTNARELSHVRYIESLFERTLYLLSDNDNNGYGKNTQNYHRTHSLSLSKFVLLSNSFSADEGCCTRSFGSNVSAARRDAYDWKCTSMDDYEEVGRLPSSSNEKLILTDMLVQPGCRVLRVQVNGTLA